MQKNNEKKVTDFVAAVGKESFAAMLDSDTYRSILIEMAQRLLKGAAAPLAGAIIGAASPRFSNIVLSYKQNRLERNALSLINALSNRVEDLENNYLQLNNEMQEKYCTLYVEMLLDSVVEEPQEEKVKWSVNRRDQKGKFHWDKFIRVWNYYVKAPRITTSI